MTFTKNPTPKHIKKIATGMIKNSKLADKFCYYCHTELETDKFGTYEWCIGCGRSDVKEIEEYLKGKK